MPGALAPPLEGITAEGEAYDLRDDESDRLLLFYRGAGCGLCRLRLEELAQRFPEYEALGVSAIAVSGSREGGAEPLLDASGIARVTVDSAALERWGMGAAAGGPLFLAYLLDSRGIVLHARRSAVGADRIPDAELLTVLEQRRRAR